MTTGSYDFEFLDLRDRKWLDFASAHERATFFHHPAWARLLADCYGFRGFALGVVSLGKLVAGLPVIEHKTARGRKSWISLPFTDHCEPLCTTSIDEAQLESILTEARSESGLASIDVAAKLDPHGGRLFDAGVIHRLELERDPARVFARFSNMRVRAIRKAEKGPASVRSGRQAADLDTIFYRLHGETRRRQGVPVQPRRFFRFVWERVMEPGFGSVLIAEVDGEPVAGAVFFHWNGTTIYKYGASDPAAWGFHPNDLIFAEAIRAACGRGDHTFDWGRSEVGNAGLRAFKAAWAAAEEPLAYWSSGARTGAGVKSDYLRRLAEPVLRRAPIQVGRLLGTLLYPRMPRLSFASLSPVKSDRVTPAPRPPS